jgi:hypothetical protein
MAEERDVRAILAENPLVAGCAAHAPALPNPNPCVETAVVC